MPAFSFKRLPARYARILSPLILSILMSAVVSFIATLNNVGFVPNLLWLWLSAWKVSWVIAFPALLIVMPMVRRIVSMLVEPTSPHG